MLIYSGHKNYNSPECAVLEEYMTKMKYIEITSKSISISMVVLGVMFNPLSLLVMYSHSLPQTPRDNNWFTKGVSVLGATLSIMGDIFAWGGDFVIKIMDSQAKDSSALCFESLKKDSGVLADVKKEKRNFTNQDNQVELECDKLGIKDVQKNNNITHTLYYTPFAQTHKELFQTKFLNQKYYHDYHASSALLVATTFITTITTAIAGIVKPPFSPLPFILSGIGAFLFGTSGSIYSIKAFNIELNNINYNIAQLNNKNITCIHYTLLKPLTTHCIGELGKYTNYQKCIVEVVNKKIISIKEYIHYNNDRIEALKESIIFHDKYLNNTTKFIKYEYIYFYKGKKEYEFIKQKLKLHLDKYNSFIKAFQADYTNYSLKAPINTKLLKAEKEMREVKKDFDILIGKVTKIFNAFIEDWQKTEKKGEILLSKEEFEKEKSQPVFYSYKYFFKYNYKEEISNKSCKNAMGDTDESNYNICISSEGEYNNKCLSHEVNYHLTDIC